MSRPIMLVFLLVILIVTSQFEWRQPLLELDAAPSLSHKHQQIAKREDAVKEKVHSLILNSSHGNSLFVFMVWFCDCGDFIISLSCNP